MTWPDNSPPQQREVHPCFGWPVGVDIDRLVVAQQEETSVWDLSQWPPTRNETFPCQLIAASRHPVHGWWGPVFTPQGPRWCLQGDPRDARTLTLDPPLAAGVGWYGDRMVAFARSTEGEFLGPYWGRPKAHSLNFMQGFPQQSSAPGGLTRRGDGEPIMIWAGAGWISRDDEWHPIYPLDLEPTEWRGRSSTSLAWECTTAPWGADGFFYVSRGRLFEARPREVAVRHLSDFDRVLTVAPGPRGTLLLLTDQATRDEFGMLYDPQAGTVRDLPLDWLQLGASWLGYSERLQRLIVLGGGLVAIGPDALFGLPTRHAALPAPRGAALQGRLASMVNALYHADATAREHAARVLGAMRPPAAAVPALLGKLSDAHPDVRDAALQALLKIPPPARLEQVADDGSPRVQTELVRLRDMHGFDPPSAADLRDIVSHLEDGVPTVEGCRRLAALGAGGVTALPALVDYIEDAAPGHVLEAAFEAVAAMGPGAAPAVAAVTAWLRTEAWRSAACCLAALGPTAVSALPALDDQRPRDGDFIQRCVDWIKTPEVPNA